MNGQELKNEVMFQTNNDADDLGDFMPYLNDYINEGYDKLVYAYYGEHVSMVSEKFGKITRDRQEPNLPEWAHRAIADYATWMIYRNGNIQKQSRGQQYLAAFNDVLSRIYAMSAEEKGIEGVTKYGRYFRNIPR